MMKRKVVITATITTTVALCGAIATLLWYLNRPFSIVPPTAALYDGRYDLGGHYQVTRFNADGRHRIVVGLFSTIRNGEPGEYHLKLPLDLHILTTQYENPWPTSGRRRGPLDYLLRYLRVNRSRDKVVQWIAESGDAVATVHTPPGADGRFLLSIELQNVVLRKEEIPGPSHNGAQQPDPDRCRIDSLKLGPIEFGR